MMAIFEERVKGQIDTYKRFADHNFYEKPKTSVCSILIGRELERGHVSTNRKIPYS